MTLREAARASARSITTLRRYIRSGRLRADKCGGRFGPEYVVCEQSLIDAGLEPTRGADAGRASTDLATISPTHDEGPSPPPAHDVVPLGLYQELQMKHEQLLVQYGMVRAGGLRALEQRGEMERRQRELEATREVERRLRRELEQQTAHLRAARLELEGRALEIDALRAKVRGLEMLTRNAATSAEIERQFREVAEQARRVQDLTDATPRPLAGGEHAGRGRPDPDH